MVHPRTAFLLLPEVALGDWPNVTLRDVVTSLLPLRPALIFAPAVRFLDTGANAFVLTLLADSPAPVVLKTAAASVMAGAARLTLMPLDTWRAVRGVIALGYFL